MLERLRNNKKEDQGFTLIELLVVMIIIGILAAIAIPIFLSQREKAEDAAARADVSTLGKEMATYYVDSSGAPPAIATSAGKYYLGSVATDNLVGNMSDNVVVGTVTGTGSTDWCIPVTNAEGDVAVTGVKYSAQGGLEDGTC